MLKVTKSGLSAQSSVALDHWNIKLSKFIWTSYTRNTSSSSPKKLSAPPKERQVKVSPLTSGSGPVSSTANGRSLKTSYNDSGTWQRDDTILHSSGICKALTMFLRMNLSNYNPILSTIRAHGIGWGMSLPLRHPPINLSFLNYSEWQQLIPSTSPAGSNLHPGNFIWL